MNVSVVVCDPGNEAVYAQQMLQVATNSVKLAGKSASVVPPAQAIDKALSEGSEYCHFIHHETIVLPGFYAAMTQACEFEKTDFAFCKCAFVRNEPSLQEAPAPDAFALSQLLIKSWVIRELGDKNLPNLINRVLAQYRGTEVPHVLTMEISL